MDFWENLSEQLNQMDGAVKTGEQWKKCWTDLRYQMRKQAKAPDEAENKSTRSCMTPPQKLKLFEYIEKNEDL